MLSRITAIGAVALALGMGLAPVRASESAFQKRDVLADCLSKAGVPTDSPGSDDYKLDMSPFNLRLNYTPVAIAVPTTVQHIQNAVACAAKLGVKANAKGGGHSYASFGLGGTDGHLVIELDRMNAVVLNNSSGVASVEGGSRLGHVASELLAQGNRGFSHGTCPGVGVGGHSINGGFGMSSHTKGLALDWLVGATVVLANSSVVNVSATENPDLFWAIRGAGGSMGIVSTFYFNTFVVPETLTFFVASVPWGTQERALSGLKAVQDFALNQMPAELNMRVFITGKFVNFEGLFWGNKDGLKTALQPLLNKTSATLQLQQEGTWLDQLQHFANLPLDQGHPYNSHETFYSTSLYTKSMADDQIKALVSYWFTSAKANKRDWYLQIDLHGGNTSAVTTPGVDSTSYAHRDYLFMMAFYDRVDNGKAYPADGSNCMKNFVGNITAAGMSEFGQYVNYPDSSLSQADAQANYWGQHLPKLQAIKTAVDPLNVFHFPQGILPVAA